MNSKTKFKEESCFCFYTHRKVMDLAEMQPETTHRVDCELDDGAGLVHFLLTITATMGCEAVSDLATYVPDPKQMKAIEDSYVS